MNPETKILLTEYEEEFKNYKNYIDSNNWYDDVFLNSRNNKLESTKLNTETSIIETIIKSTTKFKEDVGEDIDKKPIQSFINFISEIINRHIERVQKYKKMYPLTEGAVESEVEFHSDLFALITKTKVALSKLKIDENEISRKSIDLFYGNSKAPLMMREYLCDNFQIIKDKTENLDIDFSAAHINPATSNELLVNMKPKDIPPWDINKHFFEQEISTIQFWEEERKKITNGINIGGYHISNWLYWHTNVFKMAYGAEEEKDMKIALFRDNEYFFDHMYNKAKKHGRQGVFMYGSRRFAKSAGMTSRLLHSMWIIKNAKGTVQGFSKTPDLEALITYANDAIQNMFPALRIPANSLTLEDGIILGLKGKKVQERYDFATLTIINLEGGNTKKGGQKTAGATPDVFLLDEAGKGKCIPPWKAATPSFAGGKGGKWRLVPLLSGCVCAGTKVYNNKGELVNIEDLKKEEGIIGFNKNNNEISKEPITWFQPPSEKPCYKITTMKGYSIECSYEHPILVRHRNKKEKIEGKWVRKKEFIPTENLKIGQQIVINESVDIWGSEKMWNPRIVGWFIGDGHYGYNDIPSISSCDYEINNYISENFQTSDKKIPYYTKDDKLMLNRRLKSTGKNLRELGIFGQTRCNKTLPDNLYKYCKNDLCELLGGIFDTDGHVTIKGSKPTICFTTKCENLIIEIKHLLNKLGIHPTYNKVISKPNKLIKIETEYYVLSIGDKRSIETFYKNINFKIKYKQDILKQAVSILKNHKERIPKELKNQRVDCIKEIKYIGIKPIYNLTAGNTNTYIANQIITHNTAGEGALSVDAELMLKSPITYDILPMDWDFLEEFIDPDYVTWKRNNFGFFVPAQMSLAAPDKIIMPFDQFLKKDNPDLAKIDIHVTDWKVTKEFFEGRREDKKSDLSILAGEVNSFPLDPEDCYITTEVNIFPGLEAKNRKRFIEDHGLTGEKYRLYKDANGTIHFDVTTDPLITDYPYKGGNFDAPIVMMENPLLQPDTPPLGLYIIGFDDAKQDTSDGDSVMSATIFKRSFEGGEWANRIVGYYDSRPDKKRDYYRNLYLIMKIFNARLLHENEDNGYVEFLEENHSDDLYIHISTGVGLASEENLNRNHNRKWGWSPTPNNIYHGNQKVVRYTKSDGNIVGEQEGLSGVDIMNHPMLLEELYKYKTGNNADRIRSFSLALTLAQYYDRTYQYMKMRRKTISEEDMGKKKKVQKQSRGLMDSSRSSNW